MAALLEPRYDPAQDPMVPLVMRMHRQIRETSDTFTMELAPVSGAPNPFLPGQFNMVGIPGVGLAPMSISGNPSKPLVTVHTTRVVGAVTGALKNIAPGQPLLMRGPFGTPWPIGEAEGKDVVLVAGGIGLAPLRPVIYEVMRRRELYGRLLLLYGARTPEDILYAKELGKWRSQFDMEVLVTVDRATSRWRGGLGVVSQMIARAPFDPDDSIAMVCGPEVMIRYTTRELIARGLPPDHIYVSLERNMKCGVGLCGHCQMRGEFVCLSGPVYNFEQVERLLEVWEL